MLDVLMVALTVCVRAGWWVSSTAVWRAVQWVASMASLLGLGLASLKVASTADDAAGNSVVQLACESVEL